MRLRHVRLHGPVRRLRHGGRLPPHARVRVPLLAAPPLSRRAELLGVHRRLGAVRRAWKRQLRFGLRRQVHALPAIPASGAAGPAAGPTEGATVPTAGLHRRTRLHERDFIFVVRHPRQSVLSLHELGEPYYVGYDGLGSHVNRQLLQHQQQYRRLLRRRLAR